MTTDKTSHPLNKFPSLSEEVERALRLRAWKDENFREALIADPKGVIQRLFPQCFPNGEVFEQLTIKVIEEDPYTCHIVVPSLPDEFPTPEIPEEEQLELFANMGGDGWTMKSDSSDKSKPKLPEKSKPSFMQLEYERNKRKRVEENKENTPEPNDATKSLKRKRVEASKENIPTKEELKQALSQDREFLKELQNLNENDRNKAIQTYLKEHIQNREIPENVEFKVIQNTKDTYHMRIQKLPDASHDPAVPEVKLGTEGSEYTQCCMSQRVCHTPNNDCDL